MMSEPEIEIENREMNEEHVVRRKPRYLSESAYHERHSGTGSNLIIGSAVFSPFFFIFCFSSFSPGSHMKHHADCPGAYGAQFNPPSVKKMTTALKPVDRFVNYKNGR